MNKKVAKKKDSGIVNIHGKEYKTVALRVNEFHALKKDHGIVTEIFFCDEVRVIMKASIVDNAGRVLATGHGEEFRRYGQINKTSALENAETSAIGRALASYGLGGTEFASANEVQGAIKQQGTKIMPEKVAAIKAYLEQGFIQEFHLEQRFGHAVVENLLDIEADRIINGVMQAQQEKA